jgi:uncharacterized protein YlaI
MCDCALLEEIVNCGDDEDLEFIHPRRLRLLKEKPRVRLYICPECDSYWQVDHNERGPQAIKISDPFSWDTFDDRPHRMRFMERFHGGEGQETCLWQGCARRVLKGMSLCSHHAYPEFVDV